MAFANELSAALLASSGDAIVAADVQGLIQFWNPGAERIFGFLGGRGHRPVSRFDHSPQAAAPLGGLSPRYEDRTEQVWAG
jgi:PAS domain-containing protein